MDELKPGEPVWSNYMRRVVAGFKRLRVSALCDATLFLSRPVGYEMLADAQRDLTDDFFIFLRHNFRGAA